MRSQCHIDCAESLSCKSMFSELTEKSDHGRKYRAVCWLNSWIVILQKLSLQLDAWHCCTHENRVAHSYTVEVKPQIDTGAERRAQYGCTFQSGPSLLDNDEQCKNAQENEITPSGFRHDLPLLLTEHLSLSMPPARPEIYAWYGFVCGRFIAHDAHGCDTRT